jgi:hypothetical protein
VITTEDVRRQLDEQQGGSSVARRIEACTRTCFSIAGLARLRSVGSKEELNQELLPRLAELGCERENERERARENERGRARLNA